MHACMHTTYTGSILAVLNDPSFEHQQPSWVRRSLRAAKGQPYVAKSRRSQTESGDVKVQGVEAEVVEDGDEQEEVDFLEYEVETEFVSQRKQVEPSQPRVSRETSSCLHWYRSCSHERYIMRARCIPAVFHSYTCRRVSFQPGAWPHSQPPPPPPPPQPHSQAPPASFPASLPGPPISFPGPPSLTPRPPTSFPGPPQPHSQAPPVSLPGPPTSFPGPPSLIPRPPTPFPGPPFPGPQASFPSPG